MQVICVMKIVFQRLIRFMKITEALSLAILKISLFGQGFGELFCYARIH